MKGKLNLRKGKRVKFRGTELLLGLSETELLLGLTETELLLGLPETKVIVAEKVDPSLLM